jgi:hypothetical protein
MNSASISLPLLSLFLAIIFFILSPKIRKITNTYYFWFTIGIVFFIYEIIGRFGEGFYNAIHYNPDIDDTIVISKGFLLDLCPFIALILPFSLIIDPSRKFASILAPFAIFGGLITLFGEIFPNSDGDVEWTFHYIFIGNSPNEMYFMIHFINLFLGIFVLANVPKLGWKGNIYCAIFILVYFGYVFVIVAIFDCLYNTTGVTGYDWLPGGEYGSVAQILGLSFPTVMYVAYFLITLFIVSVIWLQTYLMNKKYFCIKYKDKKIVDFYKIKNFIKIY